MNIYQKIVELRKAVPWLKKSTSGPQYPYVSSESALFAVKKKMDELGIVIIPSVNACECNEFERENKYGKKKLFFTVIDMTYKVVNADDPSECISSRWCGQGVDDFEKGIGKALTYAEKYFILKLLQIPTGRDDPDARQKQQVEKDDDIGF